MSPPTFVDKMDSISGAGLATRSDHHGCSTGVGEAWYVVRPNGKHVRTEDSPEAPQDATAYLKAVLQVGSHTNGPSKDSSWPVPPSTVKVEPSTCCHNRYEALSDEEESDGSEMDHSPAANPDLLTLIGEAFSSHLLEFFNLEMKPKYFSNNCSITSHLYIFLA